MAFLRVVRDKRGYETTYLIQGRESGQAHARLLYAFRSPTGVRVGRGAFEPSVRREIEARYPDIVFDWDALLGSQQTIEASPEPRRPRRRQAPESQALAEAPAARPRQEEGGGAPRLQVPAQVEGDSPETQMRFLAHWHGILCEQLPQRIADPARRDALMTLAQRLNPAGWIDADEIATGLQQAGEALEQLSRLLARRRRRSRRSGSRENAQDAEDAGTS